MVWHRRSAALLAAAIAAASCASLAGLGEDYRLGEQAPGGATTVTPSGAGGATTSSSSSGSTSSHSSGGGPVGGTGGTGGEGAQGGTALGGGGHGGEGGGFPPTWQVIDQLEVPIDGTVVTSTVSLLNGVVYRLHASGYFDCTGGGIACDAEYVDRPPPDDLASGLDFGIAINAGALSGSMEPAWGAFDPMHEYTVDWIGAGTRITAQLVDPNTGNNYGDALRVAILALQ